ncbi:MAG TPA: hypothetical protein VF855_09985 [Acidimicrobiales bacterium]
MSGLPAEQQAAIERWFVRRGLPHFIAHYDAATDVWTRSLPLLVALYLLVSLNGLRLGDWDAGRNLLAAAAALAVLVLVWIGTNVAHRRPALERPRRMDRLTLGLLVLGAAIPSAITGQWNDVVESLLEMLLGLGLVYLVTSYGIVSTVRWALGRLVAQLAALGNLLVRVLPLLMLFVTFLFVNAEVWEVAGGLKGLPYWLVLLLFTLVGTGFLASKLPRELNEIERFDGWHEVDGLVAGTPAEGLTRADGSPTTPALSRREWANAGTVTAISLGLQALLVGVIVALFFVTFGLLAIGAVTQERWTGIEPNVLMEVSLAGEPIVLTEQLLRVAAFLGAFTALYFTVYLVTDANYRAEFRGEVVGEIRQAFAVRASYLAALNDTA